MRLQHSTVIMVNAFGLKLFTWI